ncbi:hypothetical protein COY20_03885 [Candidatus Shapirobacteria bacterium CG_4_10_14_0_2_um_filter_40_12]|uniref:Type II secretion system protein GspG C-terminal domain-containing protein n=1 Tax=Candidatus Shapirobacteria bacterium CG_4_10_14_0_2_um_filter_40_12 TaxID=1974871 RepID=A0A2M7TRZ0_9BACT|nr:MAG: hypothetical protein COY20_03885 [Candidatus Shapirobacteria bacterium CG_4_10_14_0_2_um_filter_40_12]
MKEIKKSIGSRLRGNDAFSLVELIVVVTIIAVISVVGLVSFTGANKKARDNRRQADLEKLRIALEMVRQVGTTYPSAFAEEPVGLVPGYIQILPTDPKSGSYRYAVAGGQYTFTLDAKMEDLGSTNGDYGLGYNYRVTNP